MPYEANLYRACAFCNFGKLFAGMICNSIS